MRDRLDELNRKRLAQDKPQLTVTIALHAGIVLAGVFDDGLRAEFTVLGSAMNMLARLEARAKAENLALAASEDVLTLLGGRFPDGLTAAPVADGAQGRDRMTVLYAITHEVSVPARRIMLRNEKPARRVPCGWKVPAM